MMTLQIVHDLDTGKNATAFLEAIHPNAWAVARIETEAGSTWNVCFADESNQVNIEPFIVQEQWPDVAVAVAVSHYYSRLAMSLVAARSKEGFHVESAFRGPHGGVFTWRNR